MERLAPTRMALLQLRERRGVAARGAALLRSKRAALAAELFRCARGALEGRARLEESLRRATRALQLARALEGEEVLASLALAGAREISVAIATRKVAGVLAPEVRAPRLIRAHDARGASPGGWGLGAAEAAQRHEEAAELLVDVCSRELVLERLGEELRRTSRRVNALEQLLIPMLERAVARITFVLDERAREDLSRLRRFKARRGGGQDSGGGQT